MLFFKVIGTMNNIKPLENDLNAKRNFAYTLKPVSEMYYYKSNKDAYFFGSGVIGNVLNLGGIVRDKKTLNKKLEEFAEMADIVLEDVEIEEVTYGGLEALLMSAVNLDFIDYADDVLEKFGIVDPNTLCYEEYQLETKHYDKKTLMDSAARMLFGDTLMPEIERIFQAEADPEFKGNPVHYLLMIDNAETRDEIIKILISALYDNGRVQSNRYMITEAAEYRVTKYKCKFLYNINDSSTLVFDFKRGNIRDDEYAGIEAGTYEAICYAMECNRNKTLTILCIPNNDKRIKQAIVDRLGCVSVIEIKGDLADEHRAKEYLRYKCDNAAIEPNEKLFAAVAKKGKSFNSSELDVIFDKWFDNNLRTVVYPQYSMFESVNFGNVKAEPTGNYYTELNNMIGLRKVKKLMREIVTYYKMQRIYHDRGISNSQITMHMVFSGNPGTAKTTVARLLCGILKDNEIISSGTFVEVGRADIVGKYVGWTAKIVKDKFEEARGGVLFIDEAYSLIDDKEGMYGDEAINTIVQCMENMRDDVIVIFAGYPLKMEQFVSRNPGLGSRIAFTVYFDDYDPEELWQICEYTAAKNGMSIDAAAKGKLMHLFEIGMKSEDFGNGRYVRNLVDKARIRQASRLACEDVEHISNERFSVLQSDDFEIPDKVNKKGRAIGFMV